MYRYCMSVSAHLSDWLSDYAIVSWLCLFKNICSCVHSSEKPTLTGNEYQVKTCNDGTAHCSTSH